MIAFIKIILINMLMENFVPVPEIYVVSTHTEN